MIEKCLSFLKDSIVLVFVLASTESVAGIRLPEAPVIVVRQQPPSPYRTVYVIFGGSLSEMTIAETEVRKALIRRQINVLSASDDLSDVSFLNNDKVNNRITARVKAAPQPSVVLVIKQVSVHGSEITFRLTLLDSNQTEEVAVGELLIDTSNQLTVGDSASQSMRIAIRDVCRRFVTDSKILPLLGTASERKR